MYIDLYETLLIGENRQRSAMSQYTDLKNCYKYLKNLRKSHIQYFIIY